jgi:hypothetical protein
MRQLVHLRERLEVVVRQHSCRGLMSLEAKVMVVEIGSTTMMAVCASCVSTATPVVDTEQAPKR